MKDSCIHTCISRQRLGGCINGSDGSDAVQCGYPRGKEREGIEADEDKKRTKRMRVRVRVSVGMGCKYRYTTYPNCRHSRVQGLDCRCI